MAHPKRIARKFRELRARNEAALIPFIVAGDPDLQTTRNLVLELERRGADLIELGVPISDPMADCPANQRAIARGLKTGASIAAILAMVSELRKETDIPIILFGYFNPYMHYGCAELARDAAIAGVDGVLAVDLPSEESAPLAKPLRANGIDLIYLLAPTTPIERNRKIAARASGFLYYVSVTGVTGARTHLPDDLAEHVGALRAVTALPIGVGFGISTPEQAARVASFADAVVVGSAISALAERHGPTGDVVGAVGDLVGAMKNAMREERSAQANAGASK